MTRQTLLASDVTKKEREELFEMLNRALPRQSKDKARVITDALLRPVNLYRDLEGMRPSITVIHQQRRRRLALLSKALRLFRKRLNEIGASPRPSAGVAITPWSDLLEMPGLPTDSALIEHFEAFEERITGLERGLDFVEKGLCLAKEARRKGRPRRGAPIAFARQVVTILRDHGFPQRAENRVLVQALDLVKFRVPAKIDDLKSRAVAQMKSLAKRKQH